VAALNRFQREGGMHPFTCGGEHAPGSPVLVARIDGWHCSDPYGEGCDYRQDWAHRFMAAPDAWPKTPASAPVPAQDAPGGPGRQPDAPEAPQTAPGGFPDVQGRCPACGGSSLFVGSGGYITCSRIECPEPDAATTLLERNPRTTPDNSATSGDAADNLLREQLAEALAGHGGSKAFLADGTEWEHARRAWYAHADVAIRTLTEHLDIGEEQAWCKTCRRVWDGPRHRCESDAEQQLAANAAQLVRDQAALAQVRLLIGAYRPRLKLADPVLLAKLEAVLQQVGELEAADGGEQP
jgi:hypothetical protein